MVILMNRKQWAVTRMSESLLITEYCLPLTNQLHTGGDTGYAKRFMFISLNDKSHRLVAFVHLKVNRIGFVRAGLVPAS